MSLIEGVGDEVTQLFIALTVIAVGIAAWCSTSISDQQPLRLLFLSEPQGQHQLTVQSNATSSSASTSQRETVDASDTGQSDSHLPQEEVILRATVATINENEDDVMPEVESSCETTSQAPSSPSAPAAAAPSNNSTDINTAAASESPETQLENQERGEIPTDVSILRQRRLAFLKKQGNSLLESSGSSSDVEVATNEPDQKEDAENLMPDGIRIRLKYLNDNLKLVQGSLQEPLGDFKRRHFAVELEGNKIVRLVFNGQILQSDSETLQGYGLFDNCVVHCLVHSRHTSSSGAESTSNVNAARDQANPGPNGAYREWDLSHILYVTLGLVLGVAWYFHYHLAHLFNVASTLALLGLSTAFAISAAATYLPDTEEIRLI